MSIDYDTLDVGQLSVMLNNKNSLVTKTAQKLLEGGDLTRVLKK